jgi:hypothetical protein
MVLKYGPPSRAGHDLGRPAIHDSRGHKAGPVGRKVAGSGPILGRHMRMGSSQPDGPPSLCSDPSSSLSSYLAWPLKEAVSLSSIKGAWCIFGISRQSRLTCGSHFRFES